jgi:dihydropteroate synthase
MKLGSFEFCKDTPAIMGIVNVTPDSFSDGGQYADARSAVRRALDLAEQGADIIDIGGESTRPGADPVDAEEELRRVIPVIEGVRRESDVLLSIDTAKAYVAKCALDVGANMINDVSAGRGDEGMLALAAVSGAPICLMHMKGMPRTMQIAPSYVDVVGEIKAFLQDAIERALRAGVKRDAIAIDPGIGFGKSVHDNLHIIRRLDELSALEFPVLIGVSKKSFIGKFLGCDIHQRLEGTLAALAASINRGASILRVHDVAEVKRFVTMYFACL